MQGTCQEGITDEYSNEMAASGKEEDEEENNDNGPDQKRQKTIESRFPVVLAHRSRVSMKLLVSSGPVLLLCGTEIVV